MLCRVDLEAVPDCFSEPHRRPIRPLWLALGAGVARFLGY
jgi:hypothetical protein